MKKILFSDKFQLTKAVLEGRKTMTRRIIRNVIVTQELNEIDEDGDMGGADTRIIIDRFSSYKVGEIVAVAQSLRDMGYDPRDTKHKSGAIWGLDHTLAWTNKMFVFASECIHHIRITSVRIERLQDISNEDCLKEGVQREGYGYYVRGQSDIIGLSAKSVYEVLIDKISGKGTWESNPWVFVYEFELVK